MSIFPLKTFPLTLILMSVLYYFPHLKLSLFINLRLTWGTHGLRPSECRGYVDIKILSWTLQSNSTCWSLHCTLLGLCMWWNTRWCGLVKSTVNFDNFIQNRIRKYTVQYQVHSYLLPGGPWVGQAVLLIMHWSTNPWTSSCRSGSLGALSVLLRLVLTVR